MGQEILLSKGAWRPSEKMPFLKVACSSGYLNCFSSVLQKHAIYFSVRGSNFLGEAKSIYMQFVHVNNYNSETYHCLLFVFFSPKDFPFFPNVIETIKKITRKFDPNPL